MDYAAWTIQQLEEEKNKRYQEYVKRMKKAGDKDSYEYPADNEHFHFAADGILCEFLLELGYKELVDAFNDVPKWYA